MRKLYIFLPIFMMMLVSCEFLPGFDSSSEDSSTEEETLSPEITITSSSLNIQADCEEVNKTVTFSTTADWEISISETTKSTPNWITVSPMSGSAGLATISISLDENTNSEDRYADIYISTENNEKCISVTQSAFEPALEINENSVEISSLSGSFTVNLTSNIDWTASNIPDWIEIAPIGGNGDQTVTINHAANTTTEARTVTIKFSNTEYEKEAEITITQTAFEPTLSLDTDNESVSVNSGAFSINLTSNIDWAASNIPDWVSLSSESGNGNQLITIYHSQNTTTSARSATITFSNSEYGKVAEITITQTAFEPTLYISSNSQNVSTDSGAFSINLTSNIDWVASNIPDWISLSSESGSGDQSITIYYSQNTTTSARSATITFSNSEYGKVAEITITQMTFEPTIYISSNKESVSVNSGSFSINLTSNIDWVASNIPDWISLNPESGSGNQSITINYSQNTTTSERSATIMFSNSEYSKVAEITITQAAPQLGSLEDGGSL